MRTLLLVLAVLAFLYSPLAPSWGSQFANWSLLIAALVKFSGMASRATPRSNRLDPYRNPFNPYQDSNESY